MNHTPKKSKTREMSDILDMKAYGFDSENCHYCGIHNSEIQNLLMQCGKCKQVYYCSMKCFNADLPEHQKVCSTNKLTRQPVAAEVTYPDFSRDEEETEKKDWEYDSGKKKKKKKEKEDLSDHSAKKPKKKEKKEKTKKDDTKKKKKKKDTDDTQESETDALNEDSPIQPVTAAPETPGKSSKNKVSAAIVEPDNKEESGRKYGTGKRIPAAEEAEAEKIKLRKAGQMEKSTKEADERVQLKRVGELGRVSPLPESEKIKLNPVGELEKSNHSNSLDYRNMLSAFNLPGDDVNAEMLLNPTLRSLEFDDSFDDNSIMSNWAGKTINVDLDDDDISDITEEEHKFLLGTRISEDSLEDEDVFPWEGGEEEESYQPQNSKRFTRADIAEQPQQYPRQNSKRFSRSDSAEKIEHFPRQNSKRLSRGDSAEKLEHLPRQNSKRLSRGDSVEQLDQPSKSKGIARRDGGEESDPTPHGKNTTKARATARAVQENRKGDADVLKWTGRRFRKDPKILDVDHTGREIHLKHVEIEKKEYYWEKPKWIDGVLLRRKRILNGPEANKIVEEVEVLPSDPDWYPNPDEVENKKTNDDDSSPQHGEEGVSGKEADGSGGKKWGGRKAESSETEKQEKPTRPNWGGKRLNKTTTSTDDKVNLSHAEMQKREIGWTEPEWVKKALKRRTKSSDDILPAKKEHEEETEGSQSQATNDLSSTSLDLNNSAAAFSGGNDGSSAALRSGNDSSFLNANDSSRRFEGSSSNLAPGTEAMSPRRVGRLPAKSASENEAVILSPTKTEQKGYGWSKPDWVHGVLKKKKKGDSTLPTEETKEKSSGKPDWASRPVLRPASAGKADGAPKSPYKLPKRTDAVDTSKKCSQEQFREFLRKDRAKLCYKWYCRWGEPSKASMKQKVISSGKDCDITQNEVDQMPWISNDSKLDMDEMNKMMGLPVGSSASNLNYSSSSSKPVDSSEPISHDKQKDSTGGAKTPVENIKEHVVLAPVSPVVQSPTKKTESSTVAAPSFKVKETVPGVPPPKPKEAFTVTPPQPKPKATPAAASPTPKAKDIPSVTPAEIKEKCEKKLRKERAELCYTWYARMGQPNKDTMKKRIKKLGRDCDITPDEVELCPWVMRGMRIDVKEMNKLIAGE